MLAAINHLDLERFRALVAERLGLSFDESKNDVLANVLSNRVDTQHNNADVYLKMLAAQSYPSVELRQLAEALTVTETYFFRNVDQIRAFIEVALPQRLSARAPNSMIRILSAGCASGEEPYSLAIAMREWLPDVAGLVSLRGIDVNPLMLAKAHRAIYTNWSLRELSSQLRARWFSPDDGKFTLDRQIREAVSLDERNLIQEDATLWAPNSWDVIFCRNVVMYFDLSLIRAVIARMARALVPGGFLFLGHAETLRGVSTEFSLCHSHDTFYYCRKPENSDLRAEGSVAMPFAAPAVISPRESANDAAPWMQTVRNTAERIRALAHDASRFTLTPLQPASTSHSQLELQGVLAQLNSERFAGALEQLDALPAAQAQDPATLLLRASTLVQLGSLDAAESVCQQLLAREEMNAGAHYVLALCREARGDVHGALEEDQVAVYLDPDFAMARVHLGLLTRRLGDKASARRFLQQALLALAREDAARLLVFGGGFNREALVGLCQAELSACGSAA